MSSCDATIALRLRPAALTLAAALAWAAAAPVAFAADGAAMAGPGLGRAASAAEVAAEDISIAPDGATLPPGRGTVAEGAAVYETKCVACHGEGGQGGKGTAGALAGGIGSLASDAPNKTVGSFWPHATTLFDYVRRAMPYDSPMSLTDDEVYALCAYILSLSGIVADDAVMDAKTLPRVAMPNRDGFVAYWPRPPEK